MMPSVSFLLPQVGQDDLLSFHQAHFSTGAVELFTAEFFTAGPQGKLEDCTSATEDDDGLGYYADGVKRTLTDEQIAMFRHSELEKLRRNRDKRPRTTTCQDEVSVAEAGELEDGIALQHTLGQPESKAAVEQEIAKPAAASKKKKKKGNKGRQPVPKPDLRKRTWDVVDTGLDTLEYD